MLSDSQADASSDKIDEQKHNEGGQEESADNQQGNRRGVVMLAFGMEPVVVDLLQLAGLLQSGILVVDDVDQLLVVADDSQFAGRDVNLVECYAVEAEFLNLMLEWYLSPDIIFVLALPDAGQGFLWRAELRDKRQLAHSRKIQGCIVVFLEQ